MTAHGWTVIATLAALSMAAGAYEASRPAEQPAVTFAEHVAPLVYDNCATCHRPGEAAPFSLITYEDVARRGRLIAAVTEARVMPPWKAAPSSYAFRDERGLTSEEIAVIRRWVDAGMPKGDLRHAPPPPAFSGGWQLGEPDLVLQLPADYEVPEEGPDVYRNFALPLGLADDTWVRAIELRPSARAAVHHALFFADSTGSARRADEADPRPGFAGMRRGAFRSASLGGWAVGQQPHFYPDGMALRLPKGSDLVIQYHFHPTGKIERERSTIGLYFADRAPARTLAAIQLPVRFGYFAGISIPAGDADVRARDSFVLPVDIEGVAIGAHAHYLGREMKMTATLPDGAEKTLLWITDWDFAWQDRYFFEKLVPLPKGTRLTSEIRWDNSAANPRNPSHPPIHVQWGEQSTDEMGGITLQLVPRHQGDLDTLRRAYRRHIVTAALRGIVW